VEVASRSEVVVVSRRAREMRRRGSAEALAAAHARVRELRKHPELFRLPEEWAYARRSVVYVLLSAALLLHLALSARLPDSYRVLAAGIAAVVLVPVARGRNRRPAVARRVAWLGWAAACLLGAVGLVLVRSASAQQQAGVPAVFFGATTFSLGCVVAADGRRFQVGGLRWLVAAVLVLFLLGLHDGLARTSVSHG
jgi:hypothetical protein